jgi:hypothetical protein
MSTQALIIEKGDDGALWGRLDYKGDLITTTGASVEIIRQEMQRLLRDMHDVSDKEIKAIKWKVFYDVSAFFESFDILKISAIGDRAGINPGLMRQYASGVKYPSPEQAKKIENAIHAIAEEMKKISIYAE